MWASSRYGQGENVSQNEIERRMSLPLSEADPEIAETIERETERQHTHLELIASENFVSQAVLDAMGSVFTNKYAEGDRKSTRLNSSHIQKSRMPSSA